MGRKWGANNRPLSLLTLPCLLYLSHTSSSVLLWQVYLNRLIKPPVCHIDTRRSRCHGSLSLWMHGFMSCVIVILYCISTIEKCFFFFFLPCECDINLMPLVLSIIKTFPCACVYLFSCKWRMEHSACNNTVFHIYFYNFFFFFLIYFPVSKNFPMGRIPVQPLRVWCACESQQGSCG